MRKINNNSLYLALLLITLAWSGELKNSPEAGFDINLNTAPQPGFENIINTPPPVGFEYQNNEINTTVNLTLTLNNGWNLISLPVDMNLSQSEFNTKFPHAKTIWTYRDGKWSAYFLNSAIQKQIESNPNINTLVRINKGDGFWLKNNGVEKINFSGNKYSILNNAKLTNNISGWRLLGGGSDINVTTLNKINSAINIVWSYNSDVWSAYSPDEAMQTLINNNGFFTIKTINTGVGFWVNVK